MSSEQLLDPSYWSMYVTKDQDFFYDNKERKKVDATWFVDNDLDFGKSWFRFTQRSSNRSRQSQQTQP